VLVQGFNWESCKGRHWYQVVSEQAPAIAAAGYTAIWLPPPSDSVAPQGYLPRDLYQLNSAYGTENELRDCLKELKRWNLKVIADIVINHRCAHTQVRPLFLVFQFVIVK
jgi:alpha-amylase